MRMSIYDTLVFCEIDDMDIADDVYDFAINIGCEKDKRKCKEPYDKLMRYLCTHIELSNYKPNWYSRAHVSEFIKNNLKVFTDFMNEENRDEFKPKNYDEIDDEDFYDLYMATFEHLVIGDYSDRQYKKLLEMLVANYGK